MGSLGVNLVKRLRPVVVAALDRTGGGLLPLGGAVAAALLLTAPDGAARAEEKDAVHMAAVVAPGVAAGLGALPALTYGRDIPLPRATYPYADAVKADLVVVFKGQRVLHLMNRGEVVGSYRIALGREPTGSKLRAGDGRTPEGVYTLDWRNPNSRFHRSLHVSYPAPRDWLRAARLGVHPGTDIMIHGLPNDRGAEVVGHPYRDWTEGCIAVTSREMDEIWERVDDGTTIIIYP